MMEVNIKIKMIGNNRKLFDFLLPGIKIAIKNYFSSQIVDDYEYKIEIGEIKSE